MMKVEWYIQNAKWLQTLSYAHKGKTIILIMEEPEHVRI